MVHLKKTNKKMCFVAAVLHHTNCGVHPQRCSQRLRRQRLTSFVGACDHLTAPVMLIKRKPAFN